MRTRMRNPLVILVFVASCMAWAGHASAGGYVLNVRDCEGAPGGEVRVSVSLSNAASVASVKVQLNYDPNLLAFAGATNPAGSLGSRFGLDAESDAGTVTLRLFKPEQETAGSGLLAELVFHVNAGAEPGMSAPLVLAEAGLGTQYGADLGWQEAVGTEGATFRVMRPDQLDADRDGLPDWWEDRHFGGATNAVAGRDDDEDGFSNGDEFVAGSDPRIRASRLQMEAASVSGLAANGFVIQWQSTTGRIYSVRRGFNLMTNESFAPLVSGVEGRAGFTSFTDTPVEASGPVFYQIGVRAAP